jgi:hypothetical protein
MTADLSILEHGRPNISPSCDERRGALMLVNGETALAARLRMFDNVLGPPSQSA